MKNHSQPTIQTISKPIKTQNLIYLITGRILDPLWGRSRSLWCRTISSTNCTKKRNSSMFCAKRNEDGCFKWVEFWRFKTRRLNCVLVGFFLCFSWVLFSFLRPARCLLLLGFGEWWSKPTSATYVLRIGPAWGAVFSNVFFDVFGWVSTGGPSVSSSPRSCSWRTRFVIQLAAKKCGQLQNPSFFFCLGLWSTAHFFLSNSVRSSPLRFPRL